VHVSAKRISPSLINNNCSDDFMGISEALIGTIINVPRYTFVLPLSRVKCFFIIFFAGYPKLHCGNRTKQVHRTFFAGEALRRTSRDRCYDFLNIFAEKFSEKIGVFDSK
jgi:hypothetical protein